MKSPFTPSISLAAVSAIPETHRSQRSDRPDYSGACGVSTASPDLHITIPNGVSAFGECCRKSISIGHDEELFGLIAQHHVNCDDCSIRSFAYDDIAQCCERRSHASSLANRNFDVTTLHSFTAITVVRSSDRTCVP